MQLLPHNLDRFLAAKHRARWVVVLVEGIYGAIVAQKRAFSSIPDMNEWLNRRLILRNEYIDLTSHSLVLCHIDLCRRNMILEEDNQSICLVDWAHSGLFPRFFEVATFSFLRPFDPQYQRPLRQATEELLGLTEEEKRLIKLMKIARAASQRYLL